MTSNTPTFPDRTRPGRASIARNQTTGVRTRAVQALDSRVLSLTTSDAFATANHINKELGGLVLAGSNAYADAKAIRHYRPDLVLAIEPKSATTYTATATQPFHLDQGGIIEETLDDVLQGQRQCGTNIALTPTGFIDIGDSRPAKKAVELANEVVGDDIVLLLPVHYKWCQPDHINQLITIAKKSIHPVALTLCDGSSDPLSHRGVPEGYRKFFSSVPDAIAWRADIGGFDALTFGALASVIGQLPSLRRGKDPSKKSTAINPADTTPNILLPTLLRYARSSYMQENWFANVPSLTCDCTICGGKPVDRFSGSSEDRLTGHLHNLATLTSLASEVREVGRDQLKQWWREKLESAETAREHLAGYTATTVDPPAAVKQWIKLGVQDH
ncbi:hypothetical protein [Arthrobacter oryzae]|uniref:hypothetical protein n=1 Tax=Arthrobacter oryzae TaxID=409290 RepID=UPI00285508DB|nr:hypothetical protein [Arthrobacter oryzae]MDR6508050.1 hypothetical protein [Arthrobacter oryzae]